MEIIVNGEPRSMEAISLRQLLETLEIDPRRVAVELNSAIVPKNDYENTPLNDGDKIEIVHFVGGGETSGKGKERHVRFSLPLPFPLPESIKREQ